MTSAIIYKTSGPFDLKLNSGYKSYILICSVSGSYYGTVNYIIPRWAIVNNIYSSSGTHNISGYTSNGTFDINIAITSDGKLSIVGTSTSISTWNPCIADIYAK